MTARGSRGNCEHVVPLRVADGEIVSQRLGGLRDGAAAELTVRQPEAKQILERLRHAPDAFGPIGRTGAGCERLKRASARGDMRPAADTANGAALASTDQSRHVEAIGNWGLVRIAPEDQLLALEHAEHSNQGIALH